MNRFDANQRNTANGNYERTKSSARNGNLNVHYHKGPDGKLIQIIRPAFIKIK